MREKGMGFNQYIYIYISIYDLFQLILKRKQKYNDDSFLFFLNILRLFLTWKGINKGGQWFYFLQFHFFLYLYILYSQYSIKKDNKTEKYFDSDSNYFLSFFFYL
jgi:hypothetical protein